MQIAISIAAIAVGFGFVILAIQNMDHTAANVSSVVHGVGCVLAFFGALGLLDVKYGRHPSTNESSATCLGLIMVYAACFMTFQMRLFARDRCTKEYIERPLWRECGECHHYRQEVGWMKLSICLSGINSTHMMSDYLITGPGLSAASPHEIPREWMYAFWHNGTYAANYVNAIAQQVAEARAEMQGEADRLPLTPPLSARRESLT